ncbi:MAG TPA: hypothetical protein PLV21_00675 [Cyclobacteriaceae bacterium]|nr:hypothetical protein [Cyclobacteriaceae bacterium]HRJ80366.1 hypothetical protein [Cyclobacteriaceae bacterium]
MVILFAFLLSLWAPAHPIHISVTEIEFDEKEKELEIVMRIFADDLETSIRKARNEPELDLLHPPTNTTTDELAKEYILKRFQVTLGDKVQRLNYLGSEFDGEALVFYIQVSQVKNFKAVTIMNSVILETYDDQSNIVHVTVSGKTKSLRLMRNNPSGTLTFDK